MDTTRRSQWAGSFIVSSGKEVSGELTLAGPNTSLFLHDKEPFDIRATPDQCILGILHDLTKVSLIDCVTTTSGFGGRGSGGQENERYHVANIFPHFVVSGDYYIKPTDKTISHVHCLIDDATSLFYDFDAFGSLIDASPFIEQIARANTPKREITTGSEPEILYFTGKREIFSTDTAIGRVSATHNPRRNFGGPAGVRLDNQIFLTIAFQEPLGFEEAISRILMLIRYLDIMAGRPQNTLDLRVTATAENERLVVLQVYESTGPRRRTSAEEETPHSIDALLDGARYPETFARVLANWLDRQQTWNDARMRFDNSFAGQRLFTIDRVIGSANMFDILPSSAIPSEVPLSVELKAATAACRYIFRALPCSLERASVLNALGRVGEATLKQKIRHRAQPLLDAIGQHFPDLLKVTDEAVNCRNYYVHGGNRRFDYNQNFNAVTFLTETLEFVFAVSDLVEAGWDAKEWVERPTSKSHRFAAYRIGYRARLQHLNSLLRPATGETARPVS